jgi:5'-deoxynucleotidase YfbR-like HD superfamily hydrolase
MISPVKAAVGPGYDDHHKRLTAAIHLRFGLPAAIPVKVTRQIKRADKVSAWMEATQIAGFTEAEANKFCGKVDPALIDGLTIRLRPPVEVRGDFTARHQTLLNAL